MTIRELSYAHLPICPYSRPLRRRVRVIEGHRVLRVQLELAPLHRVFAAGDRYEADDVVFAEAAALVAVEPEVLDERARRVDAALAGVLHLFRCDGFAQTDVHRSPSIAAA